MEKSKQFSKIATLLFALVLLVTVFPTAAFAEQQTQGDLEAQHNETAQVIEDAQAERELRNRTAEKNAEGGYDGLYVEVTSIEVADTTQIVNFTFTNTTGFDFSFGWAGLNCQAIVTTTKDSYYYDINSSAGKITNGKSTWWVTAPYEDDERVVSIELTKILPLTSKGLPSSNSDSEVFAMNLEADYDALYDAALSDTVTSPESSEQISWKTLFIVLALLFAIVLTAGIIVIALLTRKKNVNQ